MFSGGKFVELPYNKENIAAKAGQPVKLNAWWSALKSQLFRW